MAPSLHSVVREALERKKISPEGIQSYLHQLGCLKRYQSAFNLLWAQCGLPSLSVKIVFLLEVPLDKVAEKISLLKVSLLKLKNQIGTIVLMVEVSWNEKSKSIKSLLDKNVH